MATAAAEVATYKKLSLAELMEVEVTSVSRRGEKISDTASSIQVVTGEEISQSGANRLTTALRLFSNLHVAQVDGRQWAITARGFNATTANKLLVLMDGRTLYTPLFAGVFWDVQQTFLPDLDRIEVISGPGATQWGSNAVNGVINITTKSAEATQGGLLFAGAGSEMPGMGGFRYGGTAAPGVFYRVYAQNQQRGGSVLTDGTEANDGWRQSQGGFRVDWKPQPADQLTLDGAVYAARFSQRNLRPIRASGGHVGGKWVRQLAPDSSLALQAYYDLTDRRVPGPSSFGEKQITHSIDLVHNVRVDRAHSVVWGVNYRRVKDDFVGGPAFFFMPGKVTQEWVQGFVQDTLTLPDDAWRLTVGAKFEHTPYSNFELQPSVRLAWRLQPQTLLWAAVSRAARTPSRVDREFFAPSLPPYTFAGGPDFKSEILHAYELGLRTQPVRAISYSASVFFHDYDDLRSLEPTVPGTSIIANGLFARSYGAELNADFQVRPNWRLRVGATELRMKAQRQSGSRALTAETVHPNHVVKLISHLDLSSHVFFNTSVRYISRIADHALPGYVEADAKLSWRPREQLEISVKGGNLLHARHAEFNPPATRRQIERNFHVQMLWRF